MEIVTRKLDLKHQATKSEMIILEL